MAMVLGAEQKDSNNLPETKERWKQINFYRERIHLTTEKALFHIPNYLASFYLISTQKNPWITSYNKTTDMFF